MNVAENVARWIVRYPRHAVIGLSILWAFACHQIADLVFGLTADAWHTPIRDYALEAGLPVLVVAGPISFALFNLPGWLILGLSTLFVGASGWRYSRLFCLSLSGVFPFMDWALKVSFYHTTGLGLPKAWLGWVYLFGIPLLGAPIGIVCWYIGCWVQRRRVKQEAQACNTHQ
jgi:hypothetical protein